VTFKSFISSNVDTEKNLNFNALFAREKKYDLIVKVQKKYEKL
jgi:hypothetical protein